MRLSTLKLSVGEIKFQFTHPGKGATAGKLRYVKDIRVSIHAPWEGCDFARLGISHQVVQVSIHAPWEGCDIYGAPRLDNEEQFQFTHPGKGATGRSHTPLGYATSFNSRTLGRVRLYRINNGTEALIFQFTHPGKGATWTS